jgi:hypothetical protein
MSAERGQLMQGVVSDLEDWGAHLLALRPTIDSSLPDPPVRNQFGWERLAQHLRLEAYPLPARSDCCTSDCVGGGKATMRLVCACVWGGRRRNGRSGKRLQSKPEAQMERALSIALKTFPPNAPVSLGSQRTAKHTCSSRYSDVC